MLSAVIKRLSIAIEILASQKASDRLELARQIVKLGLSELMKCINLCTKAEVDDNQDLLDLTIVRLLLTGEPWYTLPLVIAERQSLRRSLETIKGLIEKGEYSHVVAVLPSNAEVVPLAICRSGLSTEETGMLLQDIERSYHLPKAAIEPDGVSLRSVRPQSNTLLN